MAKPSLELTLCGDFLHRNRAALSTRPRRLSDITIEMQKLKIHAGIYFCYHCTTQQFACKVSNIQLHVQNMQKMYMQHTSEFTCSVERKISAHEACIQQHRIDIRHMSDLSYPKKWQTNKNRQYGQVSIFS